MTDKDIEKEIQAKGKTAVRVTPERIDSVIDQEHYFTAFDGIAHAYQGVDNALFAHKSTDTLTFCVLVLKNGFTVTGESACASPENFDAEIGRKIARQNAVNKIWALEGYLLKQKIHDAEK
ncbi:Gp49 family protein [Providencia huaxiensis]|uniref:Gp49 family protein n=1 Tax=Providencia huaxiensis TaxID=2027290 RepID=UPI0034E4ED13